MPIYAYKCESCGHTKDVLQKISDTPLTACPHCGQPAFKKQVTAAGFQLKGSGWYVTDFRGGSSAANPPASGAAGENSATSSASKPEGGASPAPAAAVAPAPAAPASSAGSSDISGKGKA